jgi:hypothetical protein
MLASARARAAQLVENTNTKLDSLADKAMDGVDKARAQLSEQASGAVDKARDSVDKAKEAGLTKLSEVHPAIGDKATKTSRPPPPHPPSPSALSLSDLSIHRTSPHRVAFHRIPPRNARQPCASRAG